MISHISQRFDIRGRNLRTLNVNSVCFLSFHKAAQLCSAVYFDLGFKLFTTYTFTSPFSFNSAAENGLFFFWLR
jgi:hypothetical protein